MVLFSKIDISTDFSVDFKQHSDEFDWIGLKSDISAAATNLLWWMTLFWFSQIQFSFYDLFMCECPQNYSIICNECVNLCVAFIWILITTWIKPERENIASRLSTYDPKKYHFIQRIRYKKVDEIYAERSEWQWKVCGVRKKHLCYNDRQIYLKEQWSATKEYVRRQKRDSKPAKVIESNENAS